MFKQFLFVCVIVSISLKVRAETTHNDVEKLINELKGALTEKVKAFNEKSSKWQHEVFDAVPTFDKDEEKKVKDEIKRINDEIKNIQPKKATCVDEHSKEIAQLEITGNSFYTCSSQIHASTERNVGNLQTQVSHVEGKKDSYNDRLTGCGPSSNCLKALLDDLKINVRELPAQVEKYTKEVKQLTDQKKNDLKKCSRLDDMKKEAAEIIRKIKSCSV